MITEGNFVGSKLITGKGRDSNGHNYSTFNYEYTYEYFVNGNRYEYTDQMGLHWNEKPKTEKSKEIIIRYNPKNPEEVIMTKANILGILSGFLCLGIAVSVIFILKVKGFEVKDIFRILNLVEKH